MSNNICPLMKSLIQSLNPDLLKECLSEEQKKSLSPQPTAEDLQEINLIKAKTAVIKMSYEERQNFILENLKYDLRGNPSFAQKVQKELLHEEYGALPKNLLKEFLSNHILQSVEQRFIKNEITSKSLIEILKKVDDDILGWFNLDYIRSYVQECEIDEQDQYLFNQLDTILDKITDDLEDCETIEKVMNRIKAYYSKDSILGQIEHDKECEHDLFKQLDTLLDKITDLDDGVIEKVMSKVEKYYSTDCILGTISEYDIAENVTAHKEIVDKVMESLDCRDILEYYEIDDLVSEYDDGMTLVNKVDIKDKLTELAREIGDLIHSAEQELDELTD